MEEMISAETGMRFRTRMRSAAAALPWAKLVPVTLAAGALVVWSASIGQIDYSQLNDLGLVSVLPWGVYAALVLLSVSFFVALAAPAHSERLAALLVVVLVLMLYGIPSLTQEIARFGASWKHVGVIDMILRTGNVDPTLDAYNNWPGFFSLGALITKTAGLSSAIPLLGWAPVAFNLLYLLPVRMLMLAATPDRRLVWLGIWFFYLANWVGQDYFSPQAFGYFLALVILGVLLTWFTRSGAPGWLGLLRRGPAWVGHLLDKLQPLWEGAEPVSVPSQPLQRIGLLAVVLLSFLVLVASHQLTPFSLLAEVAVLFIFDRLSLRGLPLLLAVVLSAWLTYMTVAYLSGHLSGMLSLFGQLDVTVGANLTDRLNGSPEHILVTRLRLLMTLFLWGLAFLGGLRRARHGRLDLNHALLALAPFPLIAMQNYGGELLMRIYLYALPFMVFFAAALFFPRPQSRPTWRSVMSAFLVSLGLLGLFLFVRYGNERADHFTPQELAAMDFTYDRAEPGAVLAASTSNLPSRYRGYEIYHYLFLEKLVLDQDIPGLIQALESRAAPEAYLILTRSQQAYLEMFYNLPEAAWQQLQDGLLASGRFQRLYASPEASVYLLLPPRSEEGQ
jgi:hypothetical protein